MYPLTVAPSTSNSKRSSRANDGEAPYSAAHAGSIRLVTAVRNASDTAREGNSCWRHRAFAAATRASSVRSIIPSSHSSISVWTRLPTHAW